ncbi:helix-turn-helix domain containing protein [Nocardioides sp. BP30]|uniref:TetR/AcrR family transcriptional regulator n=1 Tax=Nocardioides sp. BP30 TaxID=3036374 RepID=UPI002469260E|nr:helix-turn-helix domain-containing protein [Nocardioides sp. BP30]WGL54046.1 helix-turn-helix domain containing protein [Nocardioides sp. BP30]
MPDASVSSRTPRRDAVRNDARVLQAASEVLAECGTQASMEEIATRAGVGVGTIYRRFASKDALIDALIAQVMSELGEAADLALGAPDGTGLRVFLLALGRSFATHRRYAALLLDRGDEASAERVRLDLAELTRRAVAAGELSAEAEVGDVMALVWSMRSLIETTEEVAPGAWRRHLEIHLAGLRGTGRLSAVSAISPEQMRRISTGQRQMSRG